MRFKLFNKEINGSQLGRILAACFVLGLVFATAANATILEGLSIDSSGDGLESGGQPVRLMGVHFPSDPMLCGGDSQGCLHLAMSRVESLSDGETTVICEVLGVSSAGTHMSSCRLGDDDLGRLLVEHGLAFADRQISRRYVREERGAREAGRGLWAELNTGSNQAGGDQESSWSAGR